MGKLSGMLRVICMFCLVDGYLKEMSNCFFVVKKQNPTPAVILADVGLRVKEKSSSSKEELLKNKTYLTMQLLPRYLLQAFTSNKASWSRCKAKSKSAPLVTPSSCSFLILQALSLHDHG